MLLWLGSIARAVYGITSESFNADTSGWYQVVVELLGFPLILYGLLCELPKQIEERKWRPKISIGVMPGRPSLSEIRAMSSLPTEIVVHPNQDQIGFWFSLIIRNQGELAAKSTKLSIEVDDISFDDGSQLILWSDCNRIMPESQGKDYIYPKDVGQQLVIHSRDEDVFRFPIQNRRRGPPSESALPLRFSLFCMVWADGLDGISKVRLTVEVAKWEKS